MGTGEQTGKKKKRRKSLNKTAGLHLHVTQSATVLKEVLWYSAVISHKQVVWGLFALNLLTCTNWTRLVSDTIKTKWHNNIWKSDAETHVAVVKLN